MDFLTNRYKNNSVYKNLYADKKINTYLKKNLKKNNIKKHKN